MTRVEDRHDPERNAGKLADPTVCPDCRAVFRQGRWRWNGEVEAAGSHRCPACRRINDHLPLGEIVLRGDFLRTHRDVIMACVHSVCDRAYLDHPLERLMEIDEDDDTIRIATTSAHLARAIGRAVKKGWEGALDLDTGSQGLARVDWRR